MLWCVYESLSAALDCIVNASFYICYASCMQYSFFWYFSLHSSVTSMHHPYSVFHHLHHQQHSPQSQHVLSAPPWRCHLSFQRTLPTWLPVRFPQPDFSILWSKCILNWLHLLICYLIIIFELWDFSQLWFHNIVWFWCDIILFDSNVTFFPSFIF